MVALNQVVPFRSLKLPLPSHLDPHILALGTQERNNDKVVFSFPAAVKCAFQGVILHISSLLLGWIRYTDTLWSLLIRTYPGDQNHGQVCKTAYSYIRTRYFCFV